MRSALKAPAVEGERRSRLWKPGLAKAMLRLFRSWLEASQTSMKVPAPEPLMFRVRLWVAAVVVVAGTPALDKNQTLPAVVLRVAFAPCGCGPLMRRIPLPILLRVVPAAMLRPPWRSRPLATSTVPPSLRSMTPGPKAGTGLPLFWLSVALLMNVAVPPRVLVMLALTAPVNEKVLVLLMMAPLPMLRLPPLIVSGFSLLKIHPSSVLTATS